MRLQLFTIFTTILTIGIMHTAQAQQGGYAPPGSYQQSCVGISYNNSTQVLTAACYKDKQEKGNFSCASTLQVSACQPGTDIESIQCQLQCQAKNGTWGQGGAVPKGSYQQSCIGWKVSQNILTAACWNFSHGKIDWGNVNSGTTNNASLNLSQCGMNGDIENIRGQLLCTQPAPAGSSVNNHHPDQAPPVKGTCKEGYVWRQADPNDHVCVISQRRQDVANETATSGQFTDPNSKTKPPQCKYGYVWRQAYTGDSVCTTPQARAIALQENAEASSHTY